MTATDEKWSEQEAGTGCYLCPPRLVHHKSLTFVAHLSTSSLYLEGDQRFRGLSCLVFNNHATRLDTLPEEAFTAFMRDLSAGCSRCSRSGAIALR